MPRWLINTTLALTFTISVSAFIVQPSQSADPVYCVNCGTEWTQLLNKATMVQQLANQAQQLKTQLGQYQNMLTNSQGFSTQLWGNAVQDFSQLSNLMNQSKALAYSASNLDSQFASRFGTYASYLKQAMGPADWQNKYTQWSQQSNDNTLYTLKGLGLQASQMQNEQAMQQQLQTMASSAQGRMQALQVANMMAAQNTQQLMELRQLMMMQLQMQANYMAQQQDRQAASDAATQKFYNLQPLSARGGKTY